MRQVTIVIFIAALGILPLTGCQKEESDATQVRRARMVASENVQLKKQLEKKDQQIKELNEQIKQMEAESAKEKEKFATATFQTVQMMTEIEKQNRALIAENEKLKEELNK